MGGYLSARAGRYRKTFAKGGPTGLINLRLLLFLSQDEFLLENAGVWLKIGMNGAQSIGKKKKSGPQTINPDARINKRISARISASLQKMAAAESASKCLFCLFTVVSCSPAPDTVSKHQKTKGNIVYNVRGKEKQEDLPVLHCNKEPYQMRQRDAGTLPCLASLAKFVLG